MIGLYKTSRVHIRHEKKGDKTSRCYHKTLDVEKKAGESLESGKSLARVMHQHVKAWIVTSESAPISSGTAPMLSNIAEEVDKRQDINQLMDPWSSHC